MGITIKAVILDWAGTTVDFGSMAPVAAFRGAFDYIGLSPGDDLIRRFMGLPKKDHVRCMLKTDSLARKFEERFGKPPDEATVELVYGKFEPMLYEVLSEYATPLPGVLETVAQLRKAGIKIGSTTGYTRAMMDILCPVAEAQGYAPDCLVCPDDVGGTGRPFPYMIWENLRQLGIESINDVVKIGDTAMDILEGKNAGCMSVGVVIGSNMSGYSAEDYEAESYHEKEMIAVDARSKYAEAGADYIIENFRDILDFLENGNDNTSAKQ